MMAEKKPRTIGGMSERQKDRMAERVAKALYPIVPKHFTMFLMFFDDTGEIVWHSLEGLPDLNKVIAITKEMERELIESN